MTAYFDVSGSPEASSRNTESKASSCSVSCIKDVFCPIRVMSLALSLAGMSRSVTVAVAYIMSVTNLGWKEALKVVRVGRAVANPNLGLALGPQDQAQCQRLLLSYQSLLLSRDLCEGKCTMGQVCPTGACRTALKSCV
ncbi:hypothetical protein B566_EDAN017342 [Ephemera danica]|nr:hypothetical protein B566_EDAN017342 [Ephemera danica]